MSSNFDYLKLDELTTEYFPSAELAERQYASGQYSAELTTARKIAENVAKEILDQAYLGDAGTFDQNLRLIKSERLLLTNSVVLDNLYRLKKTGNQSTHELEGRINYTKEQGLGALESLSGLLYWLASEYGNYSAPYQQLIEPVIDPMYTTHANRLIYSMTGDNSSGKWPAYNGREKVGEATIEDPEARRRIVLRFVKLRNPVSEHTWGLLVCALNWNGQSLRGRKRRRVSSQIMMFTGCWITPTSNVIPN